MQRSRHHLLQHLPSCVAACAGATGLLLSGCSSRTLLIESEPSGAEVFVNDVALGRTPVRAGFRHFGVYDVLLTKEGYEPLRVHPKVRAPWFEEPGLDLLAAPARPRTVASWKFVLTPEARSDDPRAVQNNLLDRARAMRTDADGVTEAIPAAQ